MRMKFYTLITKFTEQEQLDLVARSRIFNKYPVLTLSRGMGTLKRLSLYEKPGSIIIVLTSNKSNSALLLPMQKSTISLKFSIRVLIFLIKCRLDCADPDIKLRHLFIQHFMVRVERKSH